MDLFYQVINFRTDIDMFFSFEDEPLLWSLMWRVHIIDFRSRILSYFTFMLTRRTPISSCIVFISLAFFLSSSFSYLNKWFVYFQRLLIINCSSSFVSIMRSSSPLDLSEFVMKLQQSVIVLNSNYIYFMSFCSARVMSFIFYQVLAFSLRTARLIFIGLSQGLLNDMNFNSSRCTRSAYISLFFLSRTSSIYYLIFQRGDPLGAYFQANWFKYTLSVALKLSAYDKECPFMYDVIFEDEVQVEILPSVGNLFPIMFLFLGYFFSPYQPAQFRLLMPPISYICSRSMQSDYIFPFILPFNKKNIILNYQQQKYQLIIYKIPSDNVSSSPLLSSVLSDQKCSNRQCSNLIGKIHQSKMQLSCLTQENYYIFCWGNNLVEKGLFCYL